MNLLAIIVIGIGLAMDAFAVSVVSGATFKRLNMRHAFRMAAFFGAFQAFMPLIGALAALGVMKYIEHFDHWVAFGILLVIGVKMIYESFHMDGDRRQNDPANLLVLLVLAIATSIDALAVGFTLSLMTDRIILAVMIIGLITFVFSFTGVFIGKKFGHFFERKIEVIGGLILIAIGTKIFLQHLLS